MAKRARRLSLLFDAHAASRATNGFAETLASHLVGVEARAGDHLWLPGWPTALVDEVDPEGARIGPGTKVEIHVPPAPSQGALSLVALVDASLTMGKGKPSRFEHTAQLLDAVLLNGRHFVRRAGIVVQGGTTRHAEPLTDPETLTGASILKVTPKGTFDVQAGIEHAVELLGESPEGPRAVLVITDGSDAPKKSLEVARPAMRAGVPVIALTFQSSERWDGMCEHTEGLATTQAAIAFNKLAELAGGRADWVPPTSPEPEPSRKEDPHEFEVVIEALES